MGLPLGRRAQWRLPWRCSGVRSRIAVASWRWSGILTGGKREGMRPARVLTCPCLLAGAAQTEPRECTCLLFLPAGSAVGRSHSGILRCATRRRAPRRYRSTSSSCRRSAAMRSSKAVWSIGETLPIQLHAHSHCEPLGGDRISDNAARTVDLTAQGRKNLSQGSPHL